MAVSLGKKILDQMHQQLRDAGVSRMTGMHEPDVDEPPPLTPNAAAVIQNQPTEMFTGGEPAMIVCGGSYRGGAIGAGFSSEHLVVCVCVHQHLVVCMYCHHDNTTGDLVVQKCGNSS